MDNIKEYSKYQVMFPKKGETLVNLSNSILKYMGVQPYNKTLEKLDNILNSKKYINVILQIYDGLGINILEKHFKEDSILRKNLKYKITSVFPATTVAATKSLLTGKYPAEHGWLGWNMYFKEDDEMVSVYLNKVKDTKDNSKVPVKEKEYMYCENIVENINKNTENEAYILWKYDEINKINSLEECRNKIKELAKDKNKKFIYTYEENPDSLIHENGIDSNIVKEKLKELEANVEKIYEDMNEDTILIITADHGLIDTNHIVLKEYPDIFNMLERTTGLEERASAIKLKNGVNPKEFEKCFNKHFGEWFILYPKEKVIQEKILGENIQKEIVLENISDYIAIGISDKSLKYVEDGHDFKANHAGITKQEMEVPLIILTK